jgi:hypothetical protein
MGEPIPEQGYRSKHRLAGLSMSHKQLTVVLPATRELVALETDHHSSKAIEDPWLVFGFLGEVNGGQDERLGRRHKLRHKGGLSRPLAYLTGQGWVLDLDLNWRRGETASLRVGDLPDRSRSSIHGAMHATQGTTRWTASRRQSRTPSGRLPGSNADQSLGSWL